MRGSSPESRFEKLVIKSSGCWGWSGAVHKPGYPMVNVKRPDGRWIPMLASRLSYSISIGTIPEKMEVCHKCDNPICTNPDHLFLGTHRDNFRDQSTKGRSPLTGAKITFEIAEKIRSIYSRQRGEQMVLARVFGLSQPEISEIVNMKKWIRPQGGAKAEAMKKIPSA